MRSSAIPMSSQRSSARAARVVFLDGIGVAEYERCCFEIDTVLGAVRSCLGFISLESFVVHMVMAAIRHRKR